MRTRGIWAPLAAALACGVAAACQSRANGGLGQLLGSAPVAGWISFLVAGVVLAVVGAFTGSLRALGRQDYRSWRLWWWSTGLLGASVVLILAAGVPLLGVSLLTVFSVVGQTTTGIALDARGVGTGRRVPLTGRRAAACLLALAGLATGFASLPSGGHSVWTLVAVSGAVIVAGVFLALQQAANGAITGRTGDPVVTALFNTWTGSIALTIGIGLAAALGALASVQAPPSPLAHPLLYTGGFLGAFFVIASSWAVRRTGVLIMSLAVIAGQLAAALVLDLVTGSAPVTAWSLLAVVCVAASVTLAMDRGSAGSAPAPETPEVRGA